MRERGKMFRWTGLIAVAAISLGGCENEIANYSIVSTRKLEAPALSSRVSGEHCDVETKKQYEDGARQAAKIPGHIDSAFSEALAKSPTSDALLDVRIAQDDIFLVVAYMTCVRVDGIPVNLEIHPVISNPELPGPEHPDDNPL